MSLLMDALKKAERARAARQEDDDPGVTDKETFSLDPMVDYVPQAQPPLEPPLTKPPGASDGMLAFELEDMTPTEPEGPEPTASGSLEATGDSLGFSLSDEELRSVEDSLVERPNVRPDVRSPNPTSYEDATAATLPSLKSARDSVNAYFDESTSASLSMEQVVAHDGDATVTGQRAAMERDATQQSARAVFAAKAARRPSTANRWAIFLGLPLVLALAAVGSYFYWLASGGSTYRGPLATNAQVRTGPLVTRTTGVPTGSSRASTTDAAPRTNNSNSAGIAVGQGTAPASGVPVLGAAPRAGATAPLVAGVGASAPASAVNAVRANAARAIGTPPSSGDLTARPTAVAEPRFEPATSTEPPVLSDAQFDAMLKRRSPLPRGFDRAGGIKITRSRTSDRFNTRLNDAYTSYAQGTLANASREYRTVLNSRPRNRDALLGLAAVAVRSGDLLAAKQHYLRVLSLNPQDGLAQAALIDVFTDIDPVAGEVQLKALLAREPGTPYLHFALGNVYARQLQWARAQASYFEAYRVDARHPDYAFNLAVSLDQLGQRQAALQYYRKALELGDERPAAFSTESVLSRIRVLANS
jgi:tetratricopeptide (TPR) repeat protein